MTVTNALPGAPSMSSLGTFTSSKKTSAVWDALMPSLSSCLPMVMPSDLPSTMKPERP